MYVGEWKLEQDVESARMLVISNPSPPHYLHDYLLQLERDVDDMEARPGMMVQYGAPTASPSS